jgi:hypothetical protein
LFLYTALVNHDQFVGLLFLYMFITLNQLASGTTFRQYFNPITLAGVTLLTFKFELSNTVRILILMAITGIFSLIYRNQLNLHKVNYTFPNIAVLILVASLSLLRNIHDWPIQFLGYGYDNAFHLAMFRGYRLTSWFPAASESNWWSDFNLFQVGPPGSSALFSTFSNALIGADHDPFLETASFLAIQILMLIALISISISIVSYDYPKKSDLKIVLPIATLLTTLIVFFTGTMVVNGFPPYVAATLVLVYWMKIQPLLQTTSVKLLNLTFAAFVVLLITPGPFVFLILPGLYLTAKLLAEFINKKDIKVLFAGMAAPFILGGISYLEFRSTSGSFGWRQILSPGGVHRPSLLLAIFITLLFIVISSKYRPDFSIWLLTLSGFLSTALLSTITFTYTGSIQYYAVKQLYVWLPLACIYILSQIWKIDYLSKNLLGVYVATILSLMLASSTFLSTSPSSGFMGTPISAVRNLANHSIWNQSVIYSDNFLEDYANESSGRRKCIIFRVNPSESDLNSRWANALTDPLRMSSKCFDGYWNSSPLTTVDVLNRLTNLDESYILVLPLSDKENAARLLIPDNVVLKFR